MEKGCGLETESTEGGSDFIPWCDGRIYEAAHGG